MTTDETCSVYETCRGAALPSLVLSIGLLGAGPGMRQSRCFVPQFGLSGPNHLLLLEILAKALVRGVNGGASWVKDVTGQGRSSEEHQFPPVLIEGPEG